MALMQHLALAGPLFIGGTLKIAYDRLRYGSFRRLRPPEERPVVDCHTVRRNLDA